jgi:hypothetical protein
MPPEIHIPERDDEGIGYSEGPRRASVAQVTALLAGPLLFLLALSVKFASVHAACRAASTLRLHLFAALFLVAVVAVAVACHRGWRLDEREGAAARVAEGALERRRVVLLVGLMLSLLSALGVVFLWLPVLLLDPCRT